MKIYFLFEIQSFYENLGYNEKFETAQSRSQKKEVKRPYDIPYFSRMSRESTSVTASVGTTISPDRNFEDSSSYRAHTPDYRFQQASYHEKSSSPRNVNKPYQQSQRAHTYSPTFARAKRMRENSNSFMYHQTFYQ